MVGDAGTVSALCITDRQLSVDFWENRLDIGIQVCQLFSDEEDRLESMVRNLVSGIDAGQKCGCCIHEDGRAALNSHPALSGLSVDEACARGQLSFVEADLVWLADG